MLNEFIPIELQEGLIVAIIVLLQLYFFVTTRNKIKAYQKAVPERNQYRIKHVFLDNKAVEDKSEDEIIDTINTQILHAADKETPLSVEDLVEKQFEEKDPQEEFTILESLSSTVSSVFENIVASINSYLLRNRNSTLDFVLLKDIVERNTEAVDNGIRITLPLPLYLGLMGTMLGIVVGLFNLPDFGILTGAVQDIKKFSDGIDILMGGVRIAMIASFIGLLLTTYNSGILYRHKKNQLEDKKNHFYTFLQRELLPILSGNTTSTLSTLQKKLTEFNEGFTTNLDSLSVLMHKNYHTLTVQERILDKLEKSDFATLVKSNLSIFTEVQNSIEELKKSSKQLEQFNNYLTRVNEFIAKSDTLNTRVSDILGRTNNFEAIAQKISSNLDNNNKLQTYLNGHFEELESHGQMMNNTIIKVDSVLGNTLDDLQTHMEEKIQEIRNFTIEEQVRMKDVLRENSENVKLFFEDMQLKMGEVLQDNQTAFAKLNRLDDLNEKFDQFLQNQKEGNRELQKGLSSLHAGTPFTRLLPTSTHDKLPVNQTEGSNSFQTGLNATYQIVAIISFITILFFLFYTKL